MKELIEKMAAGQAEQIRLDRRFLHMHPELSFEEYETSKWIKAKLAELNIPLAEGISGTSVVGVLKGEQPGPTVMFRADFDALPVQEDNELPFKSTVKNVMHACGHDTHAATLLAFARVMTGHREYIKGTIKFVFQSGEEKLPGGAVQLCKDGVMDDVDFGFGFHSAAAMNLGKIMVTPGPISAAVATYEVKVTGKGGHGSRSDQAVNPAPVLCQIGMAINQIKTETISPLEPCTVTVAYIHVGDYPNIIPGEGKLGGNIRLFNNELMKPLLEKIRSVAEGIAAAWGVACEVNCVVGYPATINDAALTEIAWSACETLGFEPFQTDPSMGAEDFAYYALEKPCCYIHVGGAEPENPDTYYPHHSSRFQLDERMLDIALKCEIGFYLKATGQM